MNKIALIGLLSVVAFGTSLRSADPQMPSPQNQGITGVRTAKIIAVDKVRGILTLQIKGKPYLLSLNPNVINKRTGKKMTWAQLVPGQLIRFVSQPQPNGQLEIVSLAILFGEGESVPAGEGASLGQTSGGSPVDVSPFK